MHFKVILFFFSAALCVHTHETRILPHNKDNHIKGEWIQTLLIDTFVEAHSRVDPQTTMLWRNSLPIIGQTLEKLPSICFFTKLCIYVSVRLLTMKIANERARSSAVIVKHVCRVKNKKRTGFLFSFHRTIFSDVKACRLKLVTHRTSTKHTENTSWISLKKAAGSPHRDAYYKVTSHAM